MRYRLKNFLVFGSCSLLLLCSISCSKNEKSGHVIPRDTFVQVYADLLIVSQQRISDPISAKGRIQELFKKYGVTEQDFRRTVAEYNEDPVEWKEIVNEVIRRLEEKRNEATTKPH